uniref:Uncharacterized protein n=1 Tax=Salix viminalis TaxID=40686 RepID=A0A6N2K852_SALVM
MEEWMRGYKNEEEEEEKKKDQRFTEDFPDLGEWDENGLWKSKHDVAAGNTITRKKSDVDGNVEAVAGVQDANAEAVAGVQDANAEAVAGNANESEELKGGGKDVEIEEESVVEKQEPGKLVSEEAVAGVHEANNANDESEELNGGGKDVEIKEESAAEKQEPGKLESLSNESAELDDVGKETLVEKEPKQAAENEEPQATKQEIADVEPEVASL